MQVQAIVGGSSYNLTDTELILAAHDGLGEAPVRRLTERGAQQHGDTDVGYRFDPRVFMLAFEFAGTASERYDERARLRQLFAAQADLTLCFTLPNAAIRSIDCKRVEAPLPVDGRGAFGQRWAYRFRAADPSFYNPTAQNLTWSLDVVSDLILPYDLPYFFADSLIGNTQAIAYTGDVDTYPVITITGPLNNPVVENETTDEALQLVYNIPAAQSVTIDCRYGYKSVTLTGGTQLILTDDSDLGTFHIAAAINGSSSRTNTFRVSGTGAIAGVTNVQIAWYNRYGGI